MKHIFPAFLLVLLLCSCMTPTARIPTLPAVKSQDMKKMRRDINRFTQNYLETRRQRVATLHYNIIKSTGPDLCDRKLSPDIGVEFMKISKFKANPWFNVNYTILKEEHEDIEKIFRKKSDDVWIQGVYKNSAAEKAGLKKGDKLISLNGVNTPTGDETFEKLSELMIRHSNSGLPIDIEVERAGKPLSFSIEPDMVCPYGVYIDETMGEINAYADGEAVYVSSQLIDYMQDDTALAAIMGHELAHNILGHSSSKKINMGLGVAAGVAVDIIVRGNGGSASAGAKAGSLIYSKEFEMEADYFSVYYMARAGYDYKSMAVVQKMLAARDYWSNYQDNETHPTPALRSALITETIKEIDLKKAFGEELLPDFKVTNKYLKNKK